VLVTSGIAVAQEAPPTAGLVHRLLYTLAPSFTPAAYHAYPKRAFALFAAATILAGFLALAIVLLIGVATDVDRRSKPLYYTAAAAAGIALVATGSRQWLPAVAAGFVALAFVRPGAIRRFALIGGIALVLVWTLGSHGALDVSYIQARFERLGTTDVNVQTRLARQHHFLQIAAEEPRSTLVGHGFAGQDLVSRNLVDAQTAQQVRDGVSDNVFFLDVFNHGLLAGLVYAALLVAALLRLIRTARVSQRFGIAGVTAAVTTAFALHFFDGYFSETVFMKMLLWLLLGLGLGLCSRRDDEAEAQ
jgi:hypothetical protein